MKGEVARVEERETRNEIKFNTHTKESGFNIDNLDDKESPF